MSWQMEVRDVFRFGDGRTVFVGAISSASGFIEAAGCDVIVDGEKVGQVEVSEELPERREPSSSADRVLGTDDVIDLSAETAREHAVRLRGH
jgi:hypothetical protein